MKKLNILAITALVLGLGAVAQAQTFSEIKLFTTPASARAGGEHEVSGDILLGFTNDEAVATITLHYSVPLAEGAAATFGTDLSGTPVLTEENEDNDDNGTIVISDLTGAGNNMLISGVKLDVSGASEPITVMLVATPEEGDFVLIDGPNSAMVIDEIVVGVEAEADEGIIRTRGGEATAELTLGESFKGAFMMGNVLEIEFSGIPSGATLKAEVTGIKLPAAAVGEDTPAVTTMDSDPYAEVGSVTSGSTKVTLGGDDGDTDNGADMRVAPDEVVLNLTLTAATTNTKITFPLSVGSIMAKITFEGDDFEDVFTDYVTVFEIRPAQCEMLYPLVTYIQDADGMPMFDTGFAIVNPAYSKGAASGHITFTFYKKDTPETVYVTSGGSPGEGLEADGRLAPGSTYTVNASELLPAANWAELRAGHVHVRTDYTNCNGLGLIYGTLGIDQSYTAIVIDADTGVK